MTVAMRKTKVSKQTVLTKSCVSVTSDCKSATPHQTVGVSAVAGNESVFLSLTPKDPQVVFSVKRQLKMQPTSVDCARREPGKKIRAGKSEFCNNLNPLGANWPERKLCLAIRFARAFAAGDQAVPFVDCADIANVAANSKRAAWEPTTRPSSFDMQSHNQYCRENLKRPIPVSRDQPLRRSDGCNFPDASR